MSCHFHLLRRRKAALKAAEAPQSAAVAEVKVNTPEKGTASQKGSKARRKDEAK